jgi:hypothetical protein
METSTPIKVRLSQSAQVVLKPCQSQTDSLMTHNHTVTLGGQYLISDLKYLFVFLYWQVGSEAAHRYYLTIYNYFLPVRDHSLMPPLDAQAVHVVPLTNDEVQILNQTVPFSG